MFQQASSLWHRITGRPAPDTKPDGATVAEDERRVWVRYDADVNVQYESAAVGDSGRLDARIRDISRGGIKLIVRRPFAAGDMLSVDLPAADGQPAITVLACVIHAKELTGGEWSLGCNFARQLDDEDLQAFGAAKSRPAPPDNRGWTRFPCNVEAYYRSVLDEHGPSLPAKVLNISASGVAFQADREIKTGTLLNAELHGATDQVVITILACVVHVTRQAEGQWALGCDFIRELTDTDLQSLRI
jgi:c-di-GMP-binding flagellar brake protein YcgR